MPENINLNYDYHYILLHREWSEKCNMENDLSGIYVCVCVYCAVVQQLYIIRENA